MKITWPFSGVAFAYMWQYVPTRVRLDFDVPIPGGVPNTPFTLDQASGYTPDNAVMPYTLQRITLSNNADIPFDPFPEDRVVTGYTVTAVVGEPGAPIPYPICSVVFDEPIPRAAGQSLTIPKNTLFITIGTHLVDD